ncbi:hypothetical protein [Pseudomonas fluorescens]|uniref:hypothetical protein n=1 Tax=Pseudomonas fluorescens TaxID=294 RepID=UPI001240E198|nr:hypothetical protein [Pseudomonas fluorescens]
MSVISGLLNCFYVGASLLAMDVNDDACCLEKFGVFEFFASKLAPTGFDIASLSAWQGGS